MKIMQSAPLPETPREIICRGKHKQRQRLQQRGFWPDAEVIVSQGGIDTINNHPANDHQRDQTLRPQQAPERETNFHALNVTSFT
ncbi:hypothetical protein [Chitinophaga rhizosphaerae]|uniref:hypothetical protein n=1 Tax=Chitinophaga rhizosphaerae TaxID=1864947 RepID=UPI000F8063F0|nr:hypothetical protein [Chitinophaga rhizosphaerae]